MTWTPEEPLLWTKWLESLPLETKPDSNIDLQILLAAYSIEVASDYPATKQPGYKILGTGLLQMTTNRPDPFTVLVSRGVVLVDLVFLVVSI